MYFLSAVRTYLAVFLHTQSNNVHSRYICSLAYNTFFKKIFHISVCLHPANYADFNAIDLDQGILLYHLLSFMELIPLPPSTEKPFTARKVDPAQRSTDHK